MRLDRLATTYSDIPLTPFARQLLGVDQYFVPDYVFPGQLGGVPKDRFRLATSPTVRADCFTEVLSVLLDNADGQSRALTVQTPSGAIVGPADANGTDILYNVGPGGAFGGYVFVDPAPGEYTALVDGVPAAVTPDYRVAFPASVEYALPVAIDTSATHADSATVTLDLRAVTALTQAAGIAVGADASQSPLTFVDDGTGADTLAGDFVYAATFRAPDSIEFRFVARADFSVAGCDVTRTGSAAYRFSEINTTVLPVALTRFVAFAKTDHNALSWTTAAEVNASHFAIERSRDGRSFGDIAEVAARGAGEYAYEDRDAPDGGTAYYRLRSVDLDGSSQLSNVVAVERGATSASAWKVSPSPTNGMVAVTWATQTRGEATLTVHDATGRQVLAKAVPVETGRHTRTLDLSALPSGAYVVRLAGADGTTRARRVLRQ